MTMSNDTSNPSQILETLDWGPAPEDQSAALEWIARSGETPAHFIGGEWTPSESGQTFPTKNQHQNQSKIQESLT